MWVSSYILWRNTSSEAFWTEPWGSCRNIFCIDDNPSCLCVLLMGVGSAHNMKVSGGGGNPYLNELEDEETC